MAQAKSLEDMTEDELATLEVGYDDAMNEAREARRLVARERQRRTALRQMRAKTDMLSDEEKRMLVQDVQAGSLGELATP